MPNEKITSITRRQQEQEGCPMCGENSQILFERPDDENYACRHGFHRSVCHVHKLKAPHGDRYISVWQHMSDEELEENYRKLDTYAEVDWLYKPCAPAASAWPKQLCSLDAGCPECKTPDDNVVYPLGLYNDNWKCCHKHKLRWYVGSGLITLVGEPADWERGFEPIKDYREVRGYLPPCAPRRRHSPCQMTTFPFRERVLR